MAAQYGQLEVVRLLVKRGADRTIKDDLYRATAEGAAKHFGQSEVWEYLQAAGTA
jgi:ankyrin repeat protein